MEQEFIDYLKNENKSNGTIQTYLLNIKCYKEWFRGATNKEMKKLYRENIQNYISWLRTNKKTKSGLPLKAQTINVHINSLIKFNEFLVKTGKQTDIVITKDDLIAVQRNMINPCKVNQEEIKKFRQDILEAKSRSLNNFETIRNFCIVTLLQFSGIRISECINIKIDDICFETKELIIRNGKGNKQRTIYLNDKIISSIKNYLKVRFNNEEKFLFISRQSKNTNKPMNRTTINKIFKKYSNNITPHQERHNWATTGLETGIYLINEIQYLAGHSSLATTQLYLNPNIVKMKEKANLQ